MNHSLSQHRMFSTFVVFVGMLFSILSTPALAAPSVGALSSNPASFDLALSGPVVSELCHHAAPLSTLARRGNTGLDQDSLETYGWNTTPMAYRLDLEHPSWVEIEVVHLGEGSPASDVLMLFDGDCRPTQARRVHAGHGLLRAEAGSLIAVVAAGSPTAGQYRLRAVTQPAPTLVARNGEGEPVDEWEEGGGSANPAGNNNDGEPVDEWEEGGGWNVVARNGEGEPVDEWEEGGGSANPAGNNNDGEPVDEWEEGGGWNIVARNGEGEPVDEWEEGGGNANPAGNNNDGEPVDEWEEGGGSNIVARNDEGEPVDEWEEGGGSANPGALLCPPTALADAQESLVCARAITLGDRRRAHLHAGERADRDVFRFELDHAAAVVFESRGSMVLGARLFTATGQEVPIATDRGLGGNFRWQGELPRGAYVLRVEGMGDEGSYELLSAVGPAGWASGFERP